MIQDVNVMIGGFDDGITPSVQQYDMASRKYRMHLLEKPDVPFVLSENAVVGVVFSRSRKEGPQYKAEKVDASTVVVTVPSEEMKRAGAMDMQLKIHQDGGVLHGPVMTFMVLKSLQTNGDEVTDEPEILLQDLIGRAETAVETAETVVQNAGEAANRANAAASAAESVAAKAYVRNLLDNSDFANPVNQRGQSGYTARGFTIDRWIMNENVSAINVESGFVEMNTAGKWGILQQSVPVSTELAGKKVTFAVHADIPRPNVYLSVQQGANELGTVYAKSAGRHTICLTVEVLNSDMILIPNVGCAEAEQGIKLYWAALYEGEYTSETLPTYVPKGYTAEMLECQRYFKKIAYTVLPTVIFMGGKRMAINFQHAVPMRVYPTLMIGKIGWIYGDGTYYEENNGNYTISNSAASAFNTVYNLTFDTAFQSSANLKTHMISLEDVILDAEL